MLHTRSHASEIFHLEMLTLTKAKCNEWLQKTGMMEGIRCLTYEERPNRLNHFCYYLESRECIVT